MVPITGIQKPECIFSQIKHFSWTFPDKIDKQNNKDQWSRKVSAFCVWGQSNPKWPNTTRFTVVVYILNHAWGVYHSNLNPLVMHSIKREITKTSKKGQCCRGPWTLLKIYLNPLSCLPKLFLSPYWMASVWCLVNSQGILLTTGNYYKPLNTAGAAVLS